jgi:hypothetical protein
MKTEKGQLERLGVSARQLNAIEERIRGILRDYNFVAFSYVARKIIEAETTKNRLQREIADREAELEGLKKMVKM